MTINVGGGGGATFGVPPFPEAVTYNSVKNDGPATASFFMPLFTLANTGKTSIKLNPDFDTTNSDTIFTLNGVVQYSVSILDINASAGIGLQTMSSFVWYDNVDLALYQIYLDSNTYHLIKIANDGTITNVGSDTATNYGFNIILTNNNATHIMTRAAHGSGDFTLTYCEEAAAGVRERVTVNSGTGAASGNIPFILSGAVLTPAGGITYITADGTAAIGQSFSQTATDRFYGMPFLRADGYAMLNQRTTGLLVVDSTNPTFWKFTVWDDKVCISQAAENNASGSSIFGIRVFQRAEFDAWILEVCDFLGLPS